MTIIDRLKIIVRLVVGNMNCQQYDIALFSIRQKPDTDFPNDGDNKMSASLMPSMHTCLFTLHVCLFQNIHIAQSCSVPISYNMAGGSIA